MKKGVTRNLEVNRLVAERNARLKAARDDADRDAIIARYSKLIHLAKADAAYSKMVQS